MSTHPKVIKHKVGLLKLAEELGNVSHACKVMGYSRDTFYRYKQAVDEGGFEAVVEQSRRKPNLRNRVAQALTDATTDDALTGITLMGAVDGNVASVTADPAYDTIAFYGAATEHGAKVVVPPAKTARLSRRRPRSRARDRPIRTVTNMGRRRWKKEAGYHRQARVENAFFRYKSILSDRLRGRTLAAQDVESVLACNVLNRMTELGRPESFTIGR